MTPVIFRRDGGVADQDSGQRRRVAEVTEEKELELSFATLGAHPENSIHVAAAPAEEVARTPRNRSAGQFSRT